MERHDYYDYQILSHVETSPRVTHRMMAGKLGVSVKLAHGLLTKLAAKGLLNVKRLHSRRWDYFLTPKGIAEKARLTYEFLEFSFQFFREARRRSSEVLAGLKKEGVSTVAFLGVGELAEISFLGITESGLRLADIFDADQAGAKFLGHTVKSLEDLPHTTAPKVLVTTFDPTEPMNPNFLPDGVRNDSRLVWVFGTTRKGS